MIKPLDTLFGYYRDHGQSDYIGEPISQLQHAQQAAYLAQCAGASEPVILGAFFHDIGHLCASPDTPQMDGLGVLNHEGIGAQTMRAHGLGGLVANLVELHVQAKRYLCWHRPSYREKLSVASQGTLEFQGGAMTDEEAWAFQEHPLFKEILRLRAWDEGAKVKDGPGMELQEVWDMAERYQEGRPVAD